MVDVGGIEDEVFGDFMGIIFFELMLFIDGRGLMIVYSVVKCKVYLEYDMWGNWRDLVVLRMKYFV